MDGNRKHQGQQEPPSLEDLKLRYDDLADEYSSAERKERKLRNEVLGLLAETGKTLEFKKSDFSDPYENTVELNPDDVIEVRVTKNPPREEDEGEPQFTWHIRNKRIAEAPRKKEFAGTVEEADLDELEGFIKRMKAIPLKEEGVGFIGSIDTLLQAKKSGSTFYEPYTIYSIKNEAGEIIGASYIKKYSEGKTAEISVIAIEPKYWSSGAGSALLTKMKGLYDRLILTPVPHSRTDRFTEEELEQMLRLFYLRNGFVDARNWFREDLNLSDETTAGQWHELRNENSCIGLDKKVLHINDVARKLFETIIADPELQTQLPSNAIEKIKEATITQKELQEVFERYRQAKFAYLAVRNKLKESE